MFFLRLLVAAYCTVTATKGHVVAHLVDALRDKPEGYGFDSR